MVLAIALFTRSQLHVSTARISGNNQKMLCFLKNPVYHKLTPPKKLWLQAHPTAYSQASLAGALHGPGLETPTGRVLQEVLSASLPGFSGAIIMLLKLQRKQAFIIIWKTWDFAFFFLLEKKSQLNDCYVVPRKV